MLKNKKKLDVTPQSIILWHLPKSMSNYTKVLIKEFFMALKAEIMDCYKMVDVKDTDLENSLCNSQTILHLLFYQHPLPIPFFQGNLL